MDFAEVTEDDLQTMGVPLLHKRRFTQAAVQVRASESWCTPRATCRTLLLLGRVVDPLRRRKEVVGCMGARVRVRVSVRVGLALPREGLEAESLSRVRVRVRVRAKVRVRAQRSPCQLASESHT